MSEFNKKQLKEKFTNIKKAFEAFDTIELKGRKHIQEAIIGCYDIYFFCSLKFNNRSEALTLSLFFFFSSFCLSVSSFLITTKLSFFKI